MRLRQLSLLVVSLLATGLSVAAAADTLVVCPSDLRAGLNGWLEYRRGQGRAIDVIDSGEADRLRATIQRAATDGSLKHVVLIGDATASESPSPKNTVPTFLLPAKVNINFKSEPELASDNPYGDLDDDGVPDVAVGRITADSVEELSAITDKIVAYEQNRDFTPWRRQINFVAGMGGFSPLADSVLESTARKFITEGLPPAYAISMTYGSWRSPYCPDPRRFHETALDRLNEGCVFWVYIGHGQRRRLDRVRCGAQQYHIYGHEDVGKTSSRHGMPIALFLACYTAAFDDPRDCLAEELLRTENGPVAVVGGSRVTMPYAMTILATEMMTACFGERQPTLGEVLLQAKRQMILRPRSDSTSRAMDAMARTINPKSRDLLAERTEQIQLFNLIGDPLLKLPYPQQAALEAPGAASPGETIKIAGSSPIDGKCVVELVVRRDRLKFKPAVRDKFVDSDEALAAYQDDYGRANDPRLIEANCVAAQGRFAAELRVPDDARGPCHVRAFVTGNDDWAMAAGDIEIKPATQTAAAD